MKKLVLVVLICLASLMTMDAHAHGRPTLTYSGWVNYGDGSRCYGEVWAWPWPTYGATCIKQCWNRYNQLYINWNYYNAGGYCQ